MLYLLQTLSSWWLAALALGLVAGLFSRSGRGAPLLAFLFALGAIAASLHLLQGKYGLALETALLALASYALGGAFGFTTRVLIGGPKTRVAPPETSAPVATEKPMPAMPAASAFEPEFDRLTRGGAPEAAVAAPIAKESGTADLPTGAVAVAASVVAEQFLRFFQQNAAPAAPVSAPPAIPDDLADAAACAVAQQFLRVAQPIAVNDDHPVAAQAPEQSPHPEEAAPVVVSEDSAAESLPQIEGVGEKSPTQRPPAMNRPENPDDEDNLRLIHGIDLTLTHELHEIGIWRFAQIAAWSDKEIDWIGEHFAQMAPVTARFWPPQARLLAAGALTDHARAVLSGESPKQDEDALAGWVAGLPRPSAAGAGDSLYAGERPLGFVEPAGERDDLTRIAGIDAAMAARLNGLGIWSFRQIAHWTPENARWIGAWFATPGAPERGNWGAQARALVLANSSTP